jgi:aerobic-type carbon monoxide dehydrogenase small subunit (CoxS/CutS family)
MTQQLSFRVNGEIQDISAPANTPLLYVLRNDLQLKAAKFGCGLGHCGACSVLMDGRRTLSCETPLWACEGKSITTLEGLGTADHLNVLQKAFIFEQAAQCGYCVPGILISAQALIDQNPKPSEAEICAALDANLCRCGTHVRFVQAVLRAPGQLIETAPI